MDDKYIRKKDAVSRISDLLVLELKMTRCPTWNEVYNAIGELPSADVVPVVRCKDCNCHGTCTHEQYLGLDGFCSHGERE